MEDIVLINITGPDRPGLNACFAGILARYNVRVLDIGQSVIHEHISLGILAAIPCKKDFSAVFKDMLFEGYQLGLKVDIRPVVPDSYEKWVHAQGKERRIITILGPAISARQIAAVSSVCAEQGLNINSITRLTGRISLLHPQPHPRASIQFPYPAPEAVRRNAGPLHGDLPGHRRGHLLSCGQYLPEKPQTGGI